MEVVLLYWSFWTFQQPLIRWTTQCYVICYAPAWVSQARYLNGYNRTCTSAHRLSIGQAYSEVLLLLFGVPQGSVLGPPFYDI